MIENKMSTKAGKLIQILFDTVILPQFQKGYRNWPDGRPQTYCNMFAYAVAQRLGFDLSPLLRDGNMDNINYTTVEAAYNRACKEAKSVSAKEAQAIANTGIMVVMWSAKIDHVAVICPDANKYDEQKGPLTVQAGWYNGEMYANDIKGFGGRWTDPEIKYFVLKELVGGDK
jgi:hypothetical protein